MNTIAILFQWLAARLGRRPTPPLDTQQQQPIRGPGHDLDDFFTQLRDGPGYALEMTEEQASLQYGPEAIQMKEYLEGWPGQDD